MNCLTCGKENIIGANNRPIKYCSRVCISKATWKNHRDKMVKSLTDCHTPENDKASSERMKRNNPMKRPDIRKKVSETLKRMGHKPQIIGGNGREMPLPQRLLLAGLGYGWKPEYVVNSNKRAGGYAHCYKIDIANPELMIGIEIDGTSHDTVIVKERDIKKTLLLQSLGWTIHRFKNQYVLENLQKIIHDFISTPTRNSIP